MNHDIQSAAPSQEETKPSTPRQETGEQTLYTFLVQHYYLSTAEGRASA